MDLLDVIVNSNNKGENMGVEKGIKQCSRRNRELKDNSLQMNESCNKKKVVLILGASHVSQLFVEILDLWMQFFNHDPRNNTEN